MSQIPKYIWVPQEPDPNHHNSIGGCYGCDFRRRLDIPCSLIPCQNHKAQVAKIIKEN